VLAHDFDFEMSFGYPLRISPDGKRIMYLASPKAPSDPGSPSPPNPYQLKIIPFDGGADLYEFDWPASANAPRWEPAGDAFDYALARNGVSNIWRQKLAGGAPKQITNFESGLIFDFEWSHDGRQLALRRGIESSDVILISNLR
jgi:Tol biopolymer transport system component